MPGKWLIAQFDNRPLTEEYKVLQARNKEYCRLHGYEYIFSTDDLDMPPYWTKVKMVQKLLRTGDYLGILWLDMDAVVHNLLLKLEDLIKPGKYFYYGRESGRVFFNAGVWLIKAGPDGQRIMDAWMGQYSPDEWRKSTVTGKWKTDGGWSGITYEQGSFTENVLPLFKDQTVCYPYYFMQGRDPERLEAFVLHFMWHFKNMLPYYIEEYN
jgi:hypothetical protein